MINARVLYMSAFLLGIFLLLALAQGQVQPAASQSQMLFEDAYEVQSATGRIGLSASIPIRIAYHPHANANAIPRGTSIGITYTEPISPATVGPTTFVVHAMQTGRLTETYTVVGGRISVDPPRFFKPGELVQVSATTGTLSLGGTGPVTPTVWQFRTTVNGGRGVFTDSGQSLGTARNFGVALGDVDGDGDLDAFIANNNGQADQVWLNNGFGVFVDSGQSLGSSSGFAVALGDLDGDGDLDAFVGNAYNQANQVWLNDGTGVFTDSGQSLGQADTRVIALGDVDGDGDLDAFVGNTLSQPNEVWLNDGAGHFTDSGQRLGNSDTRGVALGDLDGDGDLDAFVVNDNSQADEVWLNDGQGIFANSGQRLGSSSGVALALGDVEGDGDLDAVVGNFNQPHQIWLNNGAGIFNESSQSLASSPCHSLALGDLDGDGDLDVVLGNANFQADQIWINNGTGSFSDSGQRLGQSSSLTVALGDVDGDGTLDIFVGTEAQGSKVWLNQPVLQLPNMVTIAGPTSGVVNTVYTFTATVSPPTTTLPITYTWQAGGQSLIAHLAVSGLTDTVTFTWPSTGTQTITVTAANAGPEVVTGTSTINILPLFTEVSAGLISVDYSSAAWGDYDNDGRLDILLTGAIGPATAKVYHNDGNGTFTDSGAGLTGVVESSVAWGDYDNDGRLDILLTGYTGSASIAKVYHNNGNGTFTDINAGLTGVREGSVAWGDYDNDGRLDILLTGWLDSSTGVAKVYHNNGNGTFTDVGAGLAGVYVSSVAWGDYDNDGRLDILLTGAISSTAQIAKVYHNNGNGRFTDIDAALTGVSGSSVAWGDYDNDGQLDILLTGWTDSSTYIAKVYHNNGNGTFTDINAGLTGVRNSSVAWGDYDNDGWLDILLAGDTGTTYIAKVYHNSGDGIFTDSGAGLTGFYWGSVAWGDYDNDSRLDILLTGWTGSTRIAKIYHNNTPATNSIPPAPTGLRAAVTGSTVNLAWNAAVDSQTPAAGLTYNLRIGTTPGGTQIATPMAITSTGYRNVPALGNANLGLTATVNITTPGKYYWSVQAIDTAWAGSPFAAEGSFSNIIVPPTGVTITGPTTGTVSTAYTFTATVNPITATTPITYVWQTTDQLPMTHTNSLSTTDAVTLTWITPGTKFITVTARNLGSPVTDTNLIVIGASSSVTDTYEPNDICSQAFFVDTPLGAMAVLTSYISRADDVDLYRLELLQPYTVISITQRSPANAESTLGLFDGPCVGGLPRAWITPNLWNLPRAWITGHGSSKTLWYNIGPYTGTYYIQVNGVNSEWSTQPYSLDITTWQGTPGFDPYEINDTCDVATPVHSGQTITGYISPISDTDHFSFTVPQPSTQVVITLTAVYSYDLDLYDGCVAGVPAAYNTPRAWITDRAATVKTLSYNVGPYTGTYYAEVYGFDGSANADNAYALEVSTRVMPVTDTQTLILFNRRWMQTFYGTPATDALITKLQQLAAQPSVNGQLMAVDDDPLVLTAYNQWVATNPEKANDVSTAIKTLLLSELGRYPNLEYIVIVGSDRMIPFRRVTDHSRFHEYPYVGWGNILPNTATGAAFYYNYFLTDDFYGDRSPTFWKGHDLYIPDFAVGRLVETPQEIMAFIDTFLAGQSTFANTSLVTGYDFVIDVSRVISDQLRASGSLSPQTLIGGNWNSTQFAQAFLQTEVDVASLNVHADHWGLGTPTPQDGGLDSAAIITATAPMSRSVYFTLGCHAGLNIPDQDGNPHTTLDLPQAFTRRAANWIGNTGYGIGGDGMPLSEQLMLLLSQELTQGDQQLIGPALVRAKQRYYTSLPGGQFDFNDEKVMTEIVLYGLPMYTLETISATRQPAKASDVVATTWQTGGPCPNRQGRIYYPQTSPVATDIGVYYQALNVGLDGGTQARPDQPVQPRLADTVDEAVRGIVFEGGTYTNYSAFDPVVTRLGNSDELLGAETVITDTLWWPARLVSLSRLDTLAGTQQRVVALPGQYRGSDARQRVYQQLAVSLYASTADDWLPPEITSVVQQTGSTSAQITVTVTDTNGLCRVIVTYTSGQGEWKSIDLVSSGGDTWRATLPLQPVAEYLIQAVDLAGNVTVDDNQGRYYFAGALHTLTITKVGNGTVVKTPDQETYPHGTVVTATAAPDPGWTFTGWSGACSGAGICAVTMDGNKTVAATFTHLSHLYLPLMRR